MKRACIGIIASFLLLSGCGPTPTPSPDDGRFVPTGEEFTLGTSTGFSQGYRVMRDTKTGVLYLESADGNLCPYFGPDGKVIVENAGK